MAPIDALIDSASELTCLGSGYQFTEGPVWDGEFLFFTHIHASRIMRYDPKMKQFTEIDTCFTADHNDIAENGYIYFGQNNAVGWVDTKAVDKLPAGVVTGAAAEAVQGGGTFFGIVEHGEEFGSMPLGRLAQPAKPFGGRFPHHALRILHEIGRAHV